MYILASQFIIAALVLFLDSISLRKTAFPSKPLLIEAVISLSIALLLLIFPTAAADLFITLLAIIVILVGITLLLLGIFYAKRAKKLDITVEGEVEVE